MIRRPPRSTLDRSSAASDVYKRQLDFWRTHLAKHEVAVQEGTRFGAAVLTLADPDGMVAVSYTHLRAHETVLDLV